MKLTADAIAAIRARAEAATEGSWTGSDSGVGILHRADWVVSNLPDESGRIMKAEDAAFIAAARTDVPALLAHVAALEAENRELRDPPSTPRADRLAALEAEREASKPRHPIASDFGTMYDK